MKIFNLIFILFVLLSSCTNGKGYKDRINEQERIIDQLRKKNKFFKTKTDSLLKVTTLLAEQIELIHSPKGKNIVFVDPNSTWISDYYFFDNNIFILDIGEHYGYVGKWSLVGDSIIINIEKKSGERGIGEPIKPEGGVPAAYVYNYNEYVPYCEKENQRISLNWNNLSREVILKIYSKDPHQYEFCSFSTINSEKILTKYDITLNGDFTFASEKILTSDDLKNYSVEDIKLIRNEIFARYGYIFQTKDLRVYFSGKKWYTPSKQNVDKYLSEIEKKNIILLKEVENN